MYILPACSVKHYRIPAAITLLVLLLALMGETAATLLRYEYLFWQQNEVWRVFTAHFIHLDWFHLLLNLAGLWIIWWLVGLTLEEYKWLILILLLSITITLGLKLWSPAIEWYVGLSGVLHGMLITGLIMGMEKALSINSILLVLLAVKIILEQMELTLSLVNLGSSQVVVDAHLYGAVVGLLFGIMLQIKQNYDV